MYNDKNTIVFYVNIISNISIALNLQKIIAVKITIENNNGKNKPNNSSEINLFFYNYCTNILYVLTIIN